MNTKRIFLSSIAALMLTASLATAVPRDMQANSTTRVRTARPTMAAGTTTSGQTTFHQRRFRDRSFVFFDGGFGFPYPYYGYYPYGYYPYNYGYYYYNQPAYGGSIVIQVQSRLARAGFYHGRIDGVMGPRTHYAIRAYERAHGLRMDGVISRQLLGTMGLRY
jgi:Putative peptidoglycan binding domain